jgi:hypothetical protein
MDGRVLSVANVHLAGHKEAASQREAQLTSALGRLRSRAWATLACGDFNSSLFEGSLLSKLLSEAGLQRVKSSCPTFAAGGSVAVLDHVFASRSFRQASTLELTEVTMAELEAGLPNANHSSDHLPVGACFRMPALLQQTLAVPPTSSRSDPQHQEQQEFLQEWCALTRVAGQTMLDRIADGARRAIRVEHRAVEAAFLQLVSTTDAEYLQQWREIAKQAAKCSVQELTAKVLMKKEMGV